MKKLMGRICLAGVMVLCLVVISFAQDCESGREMLEKTLANVPGDMTGEYLHMALQQCPDNMDFYLRIAEYYKHWYMADPNHERQSKFKGLAVEYYNKALAADDGTKSKAIQADLAKLESSREFNIVAFRALRPAPPGSTGSGLDMQVNFKLDSYELTGDMQEHINQLSKILVENSSIVVSLEGHTDVSGTRDYNIDLSIKRAESVKEYMISKFNIAPSRIQISGYGFERLADKNNPLSARNRRVEVIKLSQ